MTEGECGPGGGKSEKMFSFLTGPKKGWHLFFTYTAGSFLNQNWQFLSVSTQLAPFSLGSFNARYGKHVQFGIYGG